MMTEADTGRHSEDGYASFNVREFVASLLSVQLANKANIAEHANITRWSLYHWLAGKPKLSPATIEQILLYLGLKNPTAGSVLFASDSELLMPRIWQVTEKTFSTYQALVGLAKNQFGELSYALPDNLRGVALLYSANGEWSALVRCNPAWLPDHESAAAIGPGVVERILDGDTKMQIETVRQIVQKGHAASEDMEDRGSRQSSGKRGKPWDKSRPEPAAYDPANAAQLLRKWAELAPAAAAIGLQPDQARHVLAIFAAMTPTERQAFLSKPLGF